MTDEMLETTPFPYEWAYTCPYCHQMQGWCDYVDEDDYGVHTCDKCRKEFKLKKVQQ